MKIADMHCDTISELMKLQEKGGRETLRENGLHLDLKRMRASGYVLQNFALFVHMKKDVDPWESVCRLHETYEREIGQNSDMIARVYSYGDIADNERAGKMSALLTVEEGAVCKGDVGKLKELYGWGVRMMTLTWNYPNELGWPNDSHKVPCRQHDHFRGLTERGREFVAEMEKLGMIPDVSHLSDEGFYDVCEVTKKPFVASHSNAREICPKMRNLTDPMIRKLAERGGVMGLNFYAGFLDNVAGEGENTDMVAALVRHAKHICNVGGIEVLGLGSDFDGIETNEDLPGAQSMDRLWEGLKAGGFTEGQLDRIFLKNVLRVYKEVL